MKKTTPLLALLAALLLSACDPATSSVFDNNCSGNAMIANPAYCTGTLHPNAGPWSGHEKM